MVKTKPSTSLAYPMDIDYSAHLIRMINSPRRSYQIPGLPLDGMLITGAINKEQLYQITPGIQKALAQYVPNSMNFPFVGLVQHYLHLALREMGKGAKNRLMQEDNLTEEGRGYMAAMGFPTDDVPLLKQEHQGRLKNDLITSVNLAFEMLKTAPSKGTKRNSNKSKK